MDGLAELRQLERGAAASRNGSDPDADALEVAAAFKTPEELRNATPEEVAWLWKGYIAENEVVEVAGKPKVGKSTMVFALVEAISTNAGEFMGQAVRGGPVVYVSEEAPGTVLPKLPPNGAQLHVLVRDAISRKPWPSLIAGAVIKAREVGAVLLVIDTVSYWANLKAEAGNDQGAVTRTMGHVIDAATDGLAVLLNLHQRKSGGDQTDAVSGSNAWAASADMVLELERVEGASDASNQRLLMASGRHDPLPAPTVVERNDGIYRVVSEAAGREEAGVAAMRERVLSAIPYEAPGIDMNALVKLVGKHKLKVQPAVNDLREEGSLDRSGAGKRGDPYRYRRTATNA